MLAATRRRAELLTVTLANTVTVTTQEELGLTIASMQNL